MAITRQGGSGLGLPLNYPVSLLTGTTQTYLQGAGSMSLAAGAGYHISPGQWMVSTGPYSQVQFRDPVLSIWRAFGTGVGNATFVTSDGQNFRVVNISGCAAGAFITNVGSAYTSAPVVTASSGASTWTAIVGGAVSGTVTVSAVGSGYTYPPNVEISPPPVGGIQATATTTLSSDGIGTVTVVNQGAGYTVAPTVTFANDPRDTTGSGGTATTALTGSGTITGLICTNRGTPLTAVPTLTFTGGGGSSAAATVVMCFAATGFTVGTAGAVYGNAQPFLVLAAGGIVPGSAGASVNPALADKIMTPRMAVITGTSTAGGAVTATGAVIADPGMFQAVPTGFVTPSGASSLPTTIAIVTITVGGVSDTVVLQPI